MRPYLLAVWWKAPAPEARRREWPWCPRSCPYSRRAAQTATEADLGTPRHDKAWRRHRAKSLSVLILKHSQLDVQRSHRRISFAWLMDAYSGYQFSPGDVSPCIPAAECQSKPLFWIASQKGTKKLGSHIGWTPSSPSRCFQVLSSCKCLSLFKVKELIHCPDLLPTLYSSLCPRMVISSTAEGLEWYYYTPTGGGRGRRYPSVSTSQLCL